MDLNIQKKKQITDTILLLVASIFSVLSNFLISKILIGNGQAEAYSIIALCLNFQIFVIIFEAGINTVIIRNVSENISDKKQILILRSEFNTLFFLVILPTLLLVYIFVDLAKYYPRLLADQNIGNITILLVLFRYSSAQSRAFLTGYDRISTLARSNSIWFLIRIIIVYLCVLNEVVIKDIVIIFISSFGVEALFLFILSSTSLNEFVFKKPQVLYSLLSEIRGMSVYGAIAAIAMNGDRILLSYLLSTEDFNMYILAMLFGTLVIFVVDPITRATFPKMNQNTYQILMQATKINFLTSLIMLALLVATLKIILTEYYLVPYDYDVTAFYVFLLAFFFDALTHPIYLLLVHKKNSLALTGGYIIFIGVFLTILLLLNMNSNLLEVAFTYLFSRLAHFSFLLSLNRKAIIRAFTQKY